MPLELLARFGVSANALTVLTAMITPAVLISACGSLLISTGSRLGRVVDRVRVLVTRFEELERDLDKDPLHDARRRLIFSQLDRQSDRARLLQRAMVAFYTALGTFVGCSVAIAIVAAVAPNQAWIAVLLGIIGALFMFYGAVLLIVESRMALGAIASELEFVARVGRHYGDDLGLPRGGPFTWLGKRMG